MQPYPRYPSQPYTGDLLSMVDAGASDARYTSGTSPTYAAPFDRRYGRRLAGMGQVGGDIEVEDESADPGYASNELALLAEMDDIQANGIFDPPGTHPNIHPDAGVFAARFSLPGYHAREVPFSVTEVRDATTGRQVVAVPSGAVSLDTAAQIAFIEQGLYKTPENLVRWQQAQPMPFQSIADWTQNPQAINGFGDVVTPASNLMPTTMTTGQLVMATLAVGAAGGVLYALLSKKKGRK
jgi:hypothetical protein